MTEITNHETFAQWWKGRSAQAPPRYSREGKTLLILHNHDCDLFGVITGESPKHLWFTRHGGYFKLSKDSGEVETLKPAEF